MQTPSPHGVVADAQRGNWLDRYAPDWLKPYGRLARWDRPIPILLLFWPCGFGLGLAALADTTHGFDWRAMLLMLIGSVLMRGAGCTLNDIVDRDIDRRVARTRSRPIPSGQVTTRQAAAFLALQTLLGAVVLFQFNMATIAFGIGSLLLIAIYPFMKRVTWWPQLFLGLAFSYGAILGWTSQEGGLSLPPVLLYAGCIAWVIGYDTIYALQDVEDDALIGVKSTARLFGSNARRMIALFYAAAVVLWAAAGWLSGGAVLFTVGLASAAAVLGWQVTVLDPAAPPKALQRLFNANHWTGVLLTVALLADWQW